MGNCRRGSEWHMKSRLKQQPDVRGSLQVLDREANLSGRDENGNLVWTDFVNPSQTLGSLKPGSSLTAYLKLGTVWGKVSRPQSVQSRCTVKLKV